MMLDAWSLATLADVKRGGIAAWVYYGIIFSGVNRWGRDVHCIVGVLGKSSHTHMLVIVACKDQRGGHGLTVLLMDPKGL